MIILIIVIINEIHADVKRKIHECNLFAFDMYLYLYELESMMEKMEG